MLLKLIFAHVKIMGGYVWDQQGVREREGEIEREREKERERDRERERGGGREGVKR